MTRALKPGAARRIVEALALLHKTPSEAERREAARAAEAAPQQQRTHGKERAK